MKRRTISVYRVNIGAVGDEQVNNIAVTTIGCRVQCGSTHQFVFRLQVDLSAAFKEQLDHCYVAGHCRISERLRAVYRRNVDGSPVGNEQFDNGLLAGCRGVL